MLLSDYSSKGVTYLGYPITLFVLFGYFTRRRIEYYNIDVTFLFKDEYMIIKYKESPNYMTGDIDKSITYTIELKDIISLTLEDFLLTINCSFLYDVNKYDKTSSCTLEKGCIVIDLSNSNIYDFQDFQRYIKYIRSLI